MTRLAFIVGHYKCGTTWLINMLSLHPNIIGVSETNLFKYVFDMSPNETTHILFNKTAWAEGGTKNFPRRIVGDIVNPIRRYWKPVVGLDVTERPITRYALTIFEQWKLRKELRNTVDATDYCRRFFGFLANRFKSIILIEKSADLVRSIPRIKKVYPDAQLIAVYRDGRDFVVSHKYYAKNMGLPWSFEESVCLWRDMIEAQFQYKEKYGLWTCSYENLLKETEHVLSNILKMLDLTISTGIIRNMTSKASFEFVTGRKRGEENSKSFFRKGVSGDWRSHFSIQDKEVFKKIAGDILIMLGYEIDYNW